MGKRKQKNSKQRRTFASSSCASKPTLKNQPEARQLASIEIEENEASFNQLTDRIQQQLDAFQDKNEYFWKKERGLIERDSPNIEASASQPAIHLKRDETSEDEYVSNRRGTEAESLLNTEIYL